MMREAICVKFYSAAIFNFILLGLGFGQPMRKPWPPFLNIKARWFIQVQGLAKKTYGGILSMVIRYVGILRTLMFSHCSKWSDG